MRSLEDNIYFTLRDIFRIANSIEWCFEANKFNENLTDNVSFKERSKDESFICRHY